jgi:hypothetical protein
MKIHMPKPRSNEVLNLKCPNKQFCRYFIIKMDSWDIEGLNVNLTKNTFGPCVSFLSRQMYEEKKKGVIVDMYNVGHLLKFNAYYKDL